MSELHRKMMKRMPLKLPSGYDRHKKTGASKNYTPLDWSAYYDSFQDLPVSEADGTFRLYFKNIEDDEDDNSNPPLLILLHGAGYSALSWGLFAKSISALVSVKIVAIDLRGHGGTETLKDRDLSSERLTHDVVCIYRELCKNPKYCEHLSKSPVVMMGHSMGGAIATRATVQDCEQLLQKLAGLVVIDVVEGTALEALSGMQGILRSRPTSFSSLEKAIEWALRSGQTRNNEAARLSMPGMLRKVETEVSRRLSFGPLPDEKESLQEETEENDDEDENEDEDEDDEEEKSTKAEEKEISHQIGPSDAPYYEWRVNLFESQDYWLGWFTGLSQAFLKSTSPAKLLLLAGLDRLDKELTVGQMQGKFQMQVLPQSGHAIHEDHPDQVAQVIATFLIRNKLTVATDDFTPLPPGC